MISRSNLARMLCALGLIILSGCQAAAVPGMGLAAKPAAAEQGSGVDPVNADPAGADPKAYPEAETNAAISTPSLTLSGKEPALETETSEQTMPAAEAASSEPTAALSKASPTAEIPTLPAEEWKEWPVIPVVPEAMREVYQRGLKEGRRPEAYSILGDCQSQPDVFMGLFDSDPEFVATLPEHLQATVRQFRGSFDRWSPTVKDGTTEGALLWADWNDNKDKKCTRGETPLECELRVQQPSIVFIHVGTHWEARQERYMRRIIQRILEFGAVPVIVTKADNRELDERVNSNLVKLAVEYQLPVWNFWHSVQDLPNRGMVKNSNMYLNKQGLDVHRTGGIDALDAVWRGLK